MTAKELRVLTVRQPWAWALIHGGKDVENRVQNLAGGYRGPVAIHAGLAGFEQHNMASRALRAVHGTEVNDRIVFGAVIGVVDLVDVHAGWIEATPCSPWAIRYVEHAGQHHLVVRNPRPLRTPVPARGCLGLWRPDEDLAAAIWAQVGEAA